ncbi:lytic polysaccharide monooxygenase auxiliary activity family 9 protein [Actinomadura gamaensis]|uniref:Lytic polysaccharide monooxygenase n=1 Tax=Actinomadura gamaensis TaxID=1763541 RepID=A0ABV9U414_9ACTN
MPRKSVLAVGAATAVVLPVLFASPAFSHGYTISPPSRSYLCGTEQVPDCDQVEWDPDGIEGPKGFPAGGPPDGQICGAADDRWTPLDDQRGGTGWPTTKVTSGQKLDIVWQFTARHSTTSFRYFLTKDGWDPTQPLTRQALDLTPFLRQNYRGALPANPTTHSGTLPQRHGHHMLLSVWDIADTGNAFYQCADLDFG